MTHPVHFTPLESWALIIIGVFLIGAVIFFVEWQIYLFAQRKTRKRLRMIRGKRI